VRYLHSQLIVHRDIKLESTASVPFLVIQRYVMLMLRRTNAIQMFSSTSQSLLCLF
jgi:serine/threonine protein kinase